MGGDSGTGGGGRYRGVPGVTVPSRGWWPCPGGVSQPGGVAVGTAMPGGAVTVTAPARTRAQSSRCRDRGTPRGERKSRGGPPRPGCGESTERQRPPRPKTRHPQRQTPPYVRPGLRGGRDGGGGSCNSCKGDRRGGGQGWAPQNTLFFWGCLPLQGGGEAPFPPPSRGGFGGSGGFCLHAGGAQAPGGGSAAAAASLPVPGCGSRPPAGAFLGGVHTHESGGDTPPLPWLR